MIIFSIIIPHYNSPNSLRKLLLTIPNFSDIEVIVIDDKSDKYLTEYQKLTIDFNNKNIIFFANHSNSKGAGACRNIGIHKAKGKWLLFADADDFFKGDFYSVIKNNSREELDTVYFVPDSLDLYKMVKSNRHIFYKTLIDNYFKNKIGSELILKYNFDPPWSKLINRNVIINNNILFDETIAANDVMFSVKLGFHSTKISVSKECIYVVTKGKGTLTQDTSLNVYLSRVDVFINKVKYLNRRLNKKQLNKLKIRGARGYILLAIENKYSINVIRDIMKKFKENNIKYHLYDYINLWILSKKSFGHFKRFFVDKKYKV